MIFQLLKYTYHIHSNKLYYAFLLVHAFGHLMEHTPY